MSSRKGHPTVRLILAAIIALATTPIQEVIAPHVCDNADLTAFCLITRQLKNIVQSKDPVVPYPKFTEIFKKFPDKPYSAAGAGSDVVVHNTIHTFADVCELKYIQAKFTGGKNPPVQGSLNPFLLKVTEIYVKKKRLHNWLHLHITQTESPPRKIKMAFIIVHDKHSEAVGDFNHHIPCGSDCNCKKMTSGEPRCHQGTHEDHIPCMFTTPDLVTHPGQMMFYDAVGVDEIHATWHFSQFQFQTGSRSSFTTELHFKAILIDDFDEVSMHGRDRDGSSNPRDRKGIFGFSPLYTILYPTQMTLGTWDYFRRGVYAQKDVECHKELSAEYYQTEPYPSQGEYDINLHDVPYRESPFVRGYRGAKLFQYAFRDFGDPDGADLTTYNGRPDKLYYGVFGFNPKWLYPGRKSRDTDNRVTLRSEKEVTKTALMQLSPVLPDHLLHDRCTCPELPTTLEPEFVPPPPTQIEGRKAHALQMIIAWLCLVPFGIFVSRYYKETFSNVYFLQEYWWYMTHVLCMLAALMFMYGGLYAMNIKRQQHIEWRDKGILVHVCLGAVAMFMFTFHVFLGFFRLRKLESRLVQIFMHWFFGNVEHLFAVASMLTSSAIVQGGLSCGALFYLSLWIVIEMGLFLGMELHMRDVDERLKLNPKRSYLPPPVMRLFHQNAPDSSFRMYVLAGYFVSCILTMFILHMLIKYNDHGESCFRSRINEEESQT